MNKHEVLEKSRKSQEDEGLEYIENKGRKTAISISLIVFVLLVLYSTFFAKGERMTTVFALLSLQFSFGTAESYAKYSFYKNKSYLKYVIAQAVFALLFIAAFVASDLGAL